MIRINKKVDLNNSELSGWTQMLMRRFKLWKPLPISPGLEGLTSLLMKYTCAIESEKTMSFSPAN